MKLLSIAVKFNRISGLNMNKIIDRVNVPIIKQWILLNIWVFIVLSCSIFDISYFLIIESSIISFLASRDIFSCSSDTSSINK